MFKLITAKIFLVFALIIEIILLTNCQANIVTDSTKTIEATRQIRLTRAINPTLISVPTKTVAPVSYPDQFPESWHLLINHPDCRDYCWQGVQLGQTEEEALISLYDYLGDSRFVEMEEYQTERFISWRGYTGTSYTNTSAQIKEGVVANIMITGLEEVVLGTILQELGEPQFVTPLFPIFWSPDYPMDGSDFRITYPKQRLYMWLGSSKLYSPYLDLNSKTSLIFLQLNDLPTVAECYQESVMITWQGSGGEGVYYGANLFQDLSQKCGES